jgi:hypothetical protein
MSYFDVSLDTANKFYAWGWRGSIIGAIVTAIAVVFLMRGTHIRDKEGERQIAAANTAAGKANERAANLEVKAAGLEKEAADAKLEQEKLKAQLAWRLIPPAIASALERVLSANPGSVNIRYTDGDPEALYLAIQFSQIFAKAHWKVAAGAVKLSNAIVFGINLPDANGVDARTLRKSFSTANVSFSPNALPQSGVSFNISTIPEAPVLMVGSKQPVGLEISN